MKLTETIEKCETILSKRYEDIKKLLNHPEEKLKLVFSDNYRKELTDEKNELFEMLNNLRFIKFESNIQELDDVIEEENYGGNTPIVPDETMEELLKNGVRK
jgi:hypothetical protein